MRARTLLGSVVAVGFVAVVVVEATSADQCPVRGQGSCAKLHEMLMRPPAIGPAGPAVLAATPMRAMAERG